jgi:hypothetical protein
MGGPALLIAGAIIGFLAVYREGEWIWMTIASLCGAFCGGVLYLIISGILLVVMPTTQYSQSKEAIVPLEQNYYLGNGDVNGSVKWSYVTKTKIGNVVNSDKADKILINTDVTTNPYMEVVSKKFNSSKIESLFPAEFLAGSATIVHVPENSIKYGYNILIKN